VLKFKWSDIPLQSR